MTRPRLYINHPTAGKASRRTSGGCTTEPKGPIVGFKVLSFSTFDTTTVEHTAIWEGPRFDAPLVAGRRDGR